MTDREKNLLLILGVSALGAAALLGVNFFQDTVAQKEGEIRRLKAIYQARVLRELPGVPESPELRIAALESRLWPKGSMDGPKLGLLLRALAEKRALALSSARIKEESASGAVWELQLMGTPSGLTGLLADLESQEYGLGVRALQLRREKTSYSITMEVGYGIQN